MQGRNVSCLVWCGVCISGLVSAAEPPVRSAQEPFTIHPIALQLIVGWISDPEAPVVTELNLDAIERNRNQFDPDQVTVDGEWRRAPHPGGMGFLRYRIRQAAGRELTVEFQENAGGTLTTAVVLRMTLEQRTLCINGQERKVSVLRVQDYRMLSNEQPAGK